MTKTVKTEAILKQDGKNEFLYLKNVVLFYPSILSVNKKYQSDEKAYQFTAFVDSETREKLELPVDEGGIALNKECKEVGKDRDKKRKIKYPLEKQIKDGKGIPYDSVKGMHGIQFALNEYTKSGKKSILKVVDSEGKAWPKDKLVGNGSTASVKFFGYRNQDDQLVVFPNLIVIHEHVPYESNGGGAQEDDVLGITVDYTEDFAEREEVDVTNEVEDDEIPFEVDEDDEMY